MFTSSSDNWHGEGKVAVYGKIIDKNDQILNYCMFGAVRRINEGYLRLVVFQV